MKLYSSPLSPYSARVSFSLDYKGLPFERVKPSSLGGMRAEAFLAVSPLGKIPVLETDDGQRLLESDVIVEYLEDVYPQPSLRPQGAEARARARLIARMADLYVIGPMLGGLGPMMPIAGGRKPDALDPAAVERECAKLADVLDIIGRQMSDQGPFALGSQPTTADGGLLPYLVFVEYAAQYFDRRDLLKARPRIGRYLDEACAAEPALARTRAQLEQAIVERRQEIQAKFAVA